MKMIKIDRCYWVVVSDKKVFIRQISNQGYIHVNEGVLKNDVYYFTDLHGNVSLSRHQINVMFGEELLKG